ncbi:MAG: helicase-associated domain-containing protein [Planctomycetes bacterium]|nr:helicase-associated domain-containing protein [Planctomycetota bacterium]
MKRAHSSLAHVLAPAAAKADLRRIQEARAAQLRKAARVWGMENAKGAPIEAAIQHLEQALQDGRHAHFALAGRSEPERTLLSIVRRYGGQVPGRILAIDLAARRTATPQGEEDHRDFGRGRSPDDETIRVLGESFLLLLKGYWSSYYAGGPLPEVRLAPALLSQIPPAPPPAITLRGADAHPANAVSRPGVAVLLDLSRAAGFLADKGDFAVNQHGRATKAALAGLAKLRLMPTEAPYLLPDAQGLIGELLHGCGVIDAEPDAGSGSLAIDRWEELTRRPLPVQARHWVQAWSEAFLWQDGIGITPDRDQRHEPVRIDPTDLHMAKRVLLWALSALAHAPAEWFVLEEFLEDLFDLTHAQNGINFYWGDFAWDPDFELARKRESFGAGKTRSLAFWLDTEGPWVANVLWVTFVALGLVERGEAKRGRGVARLFRLTPLGSAVFAAPDAPRRRPGAAAEETPGPAGDDGGKRFFTLLPNHEIVVTLDAAPTAALFKLLSFAAEAGGGSDQARTYALQRETVYRALEKGATLDEIRSFLETHSRNGVPANVASSLQDWASGREAVVLRTGVDVLGLPVGKVLEELLPGVSGTTLGASFVRLAHAGAERVAKAGVGTTQRDHAHPRVPVLACDEFGAIGRAGPVDVVMAARLDRLGERTATGWQLEGGRLRESRKAGVTAATAAEWLAQSLAPPTPPALTVMLRAADARPPRMALAPGLLLRVADAEAAAALRGSESLGAHVRADLGGGWLLVDAAAEAAVRDLLRRWGIEPEARLPV